MTLSIQGDYTNGTAADGSEITTEFNYIYAGINTHAAASPADHPDGSINADKLASNAVTTIKINADAVNGTKIADDSIDSEHYVDGSIDTAHIANSQITIAKCAAGVAGYHGFLTRIKLTPSDFSQVGADSVKVDSDGKRFAAGNTSAIATVIIPSGYKATEVMVYGSDSSNTVALYANSIADGTTATAVGSGTVNTAITASTTPAMTPVTASATNYLSILVNVNTGDYCYGGYVTIAVA